MSVSITPGARDVLERVAIDGNVVRLPAGQLNRPIYEAVNRVLVAMGGKWDRKKGGHTFPFDPAAKLASVLADGKAEKRQQVLQHFDTPEELAEKLVAKLGVTSDDYCLEPSAGRGRIVAALSRRRPRDLTAIEIDADNGRALEEQGLCSNIFIKDFLSCRPGDLGDAPITVVAMNPPFKGNQDIRHVRHAYECLSEGGRLAAIVSDHGFTGREREAIEWRDWLKQIHADSEIIPAGTFKQSGTGVQTRIIFIQKGSSMTDTVLKFVTKLPLARIRHGENPRRYFDTAKHAEMVASVRLRGILHPLLLRPTEDGDDYRIVAGERRYRAALEVYGEAGEVPVTIREMTDQEALEAAIDENDIREDASETEQADAAVRVLAACQNDRAEAAKRLGWSTAKLDRRLALANLSGDVKAALDERRIKVGHAELLAAVPSDKQDQALQTIIAHGLDVNKTRDLLMRVTQSLAAATFDKGECLTCPFNSASQRALFETHVDDGFCTNPGCFKLKTEAADAKPIVVRTPDAKTPNENPVAKGIEMPAAASPAANKQAATPEANTAASTSTVAPAAKTTPTATKKASYEKAIALATAIRQEAWRKALLQAVEGDPEFAAAFDATLRDTWQVDRTFLSRFGKDELKFIAGECGLIDHMGTKAFAKLLESSVSKIIDGMLNAKGFSWAGRLPSAITLDGKYSPPPAGAGLGVHHAQPKD